MKMSFKAKISVKSGAYFVIAFIFILVFGYFYKAGAYLLFFQESQSLFVFSGDYIREFFSKPGGLLELSGKFLTQFYSNTLLGSLILAITLSLPAFIYLQISKRLIPGRTIPLSLMLFPSILLFLMQAHYYHMMEYNLGFILVFLFYLISTSPKKPQFRYLVLILFPLFYYLAGAYVWIFSGMYIISSLAIDKGRLRFLYSFLLLIIAAISLAAFNVFMFLEPLDKLLLFPLPFIDDSKHRLFLYLLTAFVLFYPLLGKISGLQKLKGINSKFISPAIMVIAISATIIILVKMYNPQTVRVIQLEKLIFNEKWEEAIELHENSPSENLIGQYFYNIALSETGQLCDRLFHGRQDFGAGSLILPWKNEHLTWGAYFYYTIGLINEAHRWAYEEMVVYGFRPQNIKLLIKTNLLNGNYGIAGKYINILKRTIYYKDWALRYERFADEPDLIQSDHELAEKINILPENNFFVQIDNPQNNILLVLTSNPENKRAIEYLMAWLLLSKDVDTAVKNIGTMKENGYTRIPVHIEEAALSYFNSKGDLPDLGGLTISLQTQLRFDQYVSSYIGIRQNLAAGEEQMREKFGNTFWFYFHFK